MNTYRLIGIHPRIPTLRPHRRMWYLDSVQAVCFDSARRIFQQRWQGAYIHPDRIVRT